VIGTFRGGAVGRAARVALVAGLGGSLLLACSASPTPQPSAGGGGGAAGGAGGLAACPKTVPAKAAPESTYTATIDTPKGKIAIKLEGKLGPNAVGNFVALAQCGYFDGVVFHRILPGFVIQGGDGQFGRISQLDRKRVGSGGPGYEFADDRVTTRYTRGTVAMANAGPNTNGSQFFIVLGDENGLDPLYSVLGHVTSGMEVVDAIAAMPNSGGQAGAATDPVPMSKVTATTP
jgi:cyclophilin family peptidyl-prolyl cis-trans isomerase